ncbi:hypothetical protein MOQ_001670 [Trypanosoma cruzi marinkellei]|uniref:Uncharacterized protein n=1 Tax=Trypanosoma cruzi marinkellei TaxID=85056 RepID=K2NK93_TRYCR|nr:hypothetical protein MOQ_001670 [Trypanosoma cruzi marinkellei]
MTVVEDASSMPIVAQFELNTSKVGHDDACMQWLKSRYFRAGNAGAVQQKNTVEDIDILLSRMENDLAACATHRWAHFSQRSPVYEATSPQTDNTQCNRMEVRIKECNTTGKEGDFIVSVQDPHSRKALGIHEDKMLAEPSRHIFTEAVRKRNQTRLAMEIETAGGLHDVTKVHRPYFGGYFLPPQSVGPTRFLLFPQWMHDVHLDATQPQELPYFLRGTIDRKSGRRSEEDAEMPEDKRGPIHKFLKSIIFNASFARKFPATMPRWRIFNDVDALRLELYVNNENSERLFSSCAKAKASKDTQAKHESRPLTLNFCDSGARLAFFFRDPRYSLTVSNAYRVAQHSSKLSTKGRAIASLTVSDNYDSAVQRFSTPLLHRWFPSARYQLQWSAGPGVEYVSTDKPWTVFGKLGTEWWVELPFFKRALFSIRNQSALVQPLSLQQTEGVDEEKDNGHTSAASLGDNRSAAHSYFWATQGPRWNPSLVRGFKDDYPSLHYASRWYTLISAELASDRRQRDKGSKTWQVPKWMIYANACFTDSFTTPPRASVGFAFSGTPRGTTDAFNVLTPSSFECSFNWWLKFCQGRPSLVSGIVPGQRAEESALRLSPFETFRHFRCGLTWKA